MIRVFRASSVTMSAKRGYSTHTHTHTHTQATTACEIRDVRSSATDKRPQRPKQTQVGVREELRHRLRAVQVEPETPKPTQGEPVLAPVLPRAIHTK
eukprot:5752481-Pyramimonas_sp.AAC.1